MPKTIKEFELAMIEAFKSGMLAGYGVAHENITECELEATIEFCDKNHFRYYGKINEPPV